MRKNYNLDRTKLILPEYGRHIHQMVDYLFTIEDREVRNEQAQAVIAVMGNLMPTLRDAADFTHKLWDHLFIMAEFNLDVDSPYPIPTAETLAPMPEKIKYPDRRVKMRHYGKNVERLIDMLVAIKSEDKDTYNDLLINLVKYMRVKSFEFNEDLPNDEYILEDIRKLSNGRIVIEEEIVERLRTEQRQQQPQRRQQSSREGGRESGRGGGGRTGGGRNQQGKSRQRNRR